MMMKKKEDRERRNRKKEEGGGGEEEEEEEGDREAEEGEDEEVIYSRGAAARLVKLQLYILALRKADLGWQLDWQGEGGKGVSVPSHTACVHICPSLLISVSVCACTY